MTLNKLLTRIGACGPAKAWARGKTLADAWESSTRVDWMLFLARRMTGELGWPTPQQVMLTGAECAALALPHAGANRAVCERTLETVRRYARGEASVEELKKARDEALSHYYAASVSSDAYAARAAAAAGVNGGYAAFAAAYAAYAAIGRPAKLKGGLRQCADICRRMLSVPVIEEE